MSMKADVRWDLIGSSVLSTGNFTAASSTSSVSIPPYSKSINIERSDARVFKYYYSMDDSVTNSCSIGGKVFVGGHLRQINGLEVSNIFSIDISTGVVDPLLGGISDPIISMACDPSSNAVYLGTKSSLHVYQKNQLSQLSKGSQNQLAYSNTQGLLSLDSSDGSSQPLSLIASNFSAILPAGAVIKTIASSPSGSFYIGGSFTGNIAQVDGSLVSDLGGLNSPVTSILTFKDVIICTGAFTATADSTTSLSHIAQFNTTSKIWTPMGEGIDKSAAQISYNAFTNSVRILGNFKSIIRDGVPVDFGGAAEFSLNTLKWSPFKEIITGFPEYSMALDGAILNAGNIEVEAVKASNISSLSVGGIEGFSDKIGGPISSVVWIDSDSALVSGSNLTFLDGTSGPFSVDGPIQSLVYHKSILYAAGSFQNVVFGDQFAAAGFLAFNMLTKSLVSVPQIGNITAMIQVGEKLVAAGSFSSALCTSICVYDITTGYWISQFQGFSGQVNHLSNIGGSLIVGGTFYGPSGPSFLASHDGATITTYHTNVAVEGLTSSPSYFYSLSSGLATEWSLGTIESIKTLNPFQITALLAVPISSGEGLLLAQSDGNSSQILLFDIQDSSCRPLQSANGNIMGLYTRMASYPSLAASHFPIWAICLITFSSVGLILAFLAYYFNRMKRMTDGVEDKDDFHVVVSTSPSFITMTSRYSYNGEHYTYDGEVIDPDGERYAREDSIVHRVGHPENGSLYSEIALSDLGESLVHNSFVDPPKIFKVKAIRNYTRQDECELSFKKGDIIEVLDSTPNFWSKGRVGEREGIFPEFLTVRCDESEYIC